jgi:alcohol dehydrogenase
VSPAHRTLDIPLRDRILQGRGTTVDLPGIVREAGGSRAFILTDPGVAQAGVADRVRTVLEVAGHAHIHAQVEPNPGASSIVRGSKALG